MNSKKIRIVYPACGFDFWDGGGLNGSLHMIRDAMQGLGPITEDVPTSLDIVYCDINPEIDIHTVKRAVDRLFYSPNQPNGQRQRYRLESTTQFHFGPEPEDERLPMDYSPSEWFRNTWAYELVGQYQGLSIRFRYFAASYQQVMYYLNLIGWTLGADDAIILGDNWRYYGEGGQNLHTIFKRPLNRFFDEYTKVITRNTVRRFHQGFWEPELVY